MKKSRLPTLAFVFSIFMCTSVGASVIYTYSGNNYDEVVLGSSFNTSMSLNGTVELSAALAPNLVDAQVLAINFSINDGINTITHLEAYPSFRFSTDSTGSIVDWGFSFSELFPASAVIGDTASSMRSSPSGDTAQILACDSIAASGNCATQAATDYAWVRNNPGTWTVSTVPIPAAVWLLISGLLGLVGVSRRKPTA